MKKNQKYATKLQKYLKENGISQRHFAAKINLFPTNLCRLVKGLSQPSLQTAYNIERETAGVVQMYDWIEQED